MKTKLLNKLSKESREQIITIEGQIRNIREEISNIDSMIISLI